MIKMEQDKLSTKEQGLRLKMLRESVTHLSRRAFAKKHGFSPGTLQNWEDGRYDRGIVRKAAEKLLRAFHAEGIDVSLNWLLYGEAPPPTHRFKSVEQVFTANPVEKHIEPQLDESQLIQITLENEKKHKINNEFFNAAATGRYREVVRLVSAGVEVYLFEGQKIKPYESEHNTPLHLSALNGHLEIVIFLIEKGAKINSRNRKNQAPLHLAVHNGHTKIIEYLIECGADINPIDDEGDTPLAWAAYKGQTDIVLLLIKLGANIDMRNKMGNTALHWSAKSGYLDIIEQLIAYEASITTKNAQHNTPLMLAVENGHLETVKFLLNQQKCLKI